MKTNKKYEAAGLILLLFAVWAIGSAVVGEILKDETEQTEGNDDGSQNNNK